MKNKNGIETDINKRWEQGIPHHPASKGMYDLLAKIDEKYGGNHFDWKCGGDGDNGEHLMYELDIHFENEDAKLPALFAKDQHERRQNGIRRGLWNGEI